MSALLEQQKNTKKKDYRSAVMYLMTLNLQSAAACSVLALLVLLDVGGLMAGLVTALKSLCFDGLLKAYYFRMYRKSSVETQPGYLKERKRMWMEGISLAKDACCLVPVVGCSHQAVLAFSGVSLRFLDTCHLVASMVLLVYFVVSTYFMISQSFCYHYAVPFAHQYISASHLLLFFQVFTLKADRLRFWYFSVVLSVFALLSAAIAMAAVYILVKLPPANVYRRHLWLVGGLAVDSFSITLANAALHNCFSGRNGPLAASLAVVSLCLASLSAGFARRKVADAE